MHKLLILTTAFPVTILAAAGCVSADKGCQTHRVADTIWLANELVVVEQQLNSVVIPEVNVEQLLFLDAVELLFELGNEQMSKNGLPGFGVIAKNLPQNTESRRFTMHLINISVFKAFEELSNTAGVGLELTRGSFVIAGPKESSGREEAPKDLLGDFLPPFE